MVDISGIKTPFYLYDLDLLRETVSYAAKEAGSHGYFIHYAIKANHDPLIAGIIRDEGLGVDCVSGNEISRSLEYGFPPGGIVFAGVGKNDDEIKLALEKDIFCLNCESLEELEVVRDIAHSCGRKARVALRVNPAVEARTHRNITTGLDENKFGINLLHLQSALNICKGSDNLEFTGLHFHIGSQITSHEPYRKLCRRVNRIWEQYRITEYGGRILNLGGGYGIDYGNPSDNAIPDFKSFFAIFSDNLRMPAGTDIRFELGRSLTGQCGRIVTRVLYTKQGVNRKFVITDAGMTELMRPSLYQAVHKIINISSSSGRETCDVVGPVCESTDVFARDAVLPVTKRGDLLQILSCGAYAASMTLNFNLREKPGSAYIEGGKLKSGRTSVGEGIGMLSPGAGISHGN
ncbi:MAG: diaminopimelate decarboxylase [Bacteroidales bacterium]